MRQAVRGGRENGNFTSLRPVHNWRQWQPQLFHNFTPGFQPAPPCCGWRTHGPREPSWKMEWHWAGAGVLAVEEGMRRKLWLWARPGWRIEGWRGSIYGPAPCFLGTGLCIPYGRNSSWRNYFYKPVKHLKDSHFQWEKEKKEEEEVISLETEKERKRERGKEGETEIE